MAIRDCLVLLESDAFDPNLSTHKLKGNLTGSWASSAAYDPRIIFNLSPWTALNRSISCRLEPTIRCIDEFGGEIARALYGIGRSFNSTGIVIVFKLLATFQVSFFASPVLAGA
jgi:hypothetical protein